MESDSTSERQARILRSARAIIESSGNFDLPMRELAAHAQVSLGAPYELFGSKNGVVQAILLEDIARFRTVLGTPRETNRLEYLFERLGKGIEFYRANQPFYRALSRAERAGTPSATSEAERRGLATRRADCEVLLAQGALLAGVDLEELARSLNALFYAAMRDWAFDTYDIDRAQHRIAFGWSMLYAGAAPDEVARNLRKRAQRHARALRRIDSATAKARSAGETREGAASKTQPNKTQLNKRQPKKRSKGRPAG